MKNSWNKVVALMLAAALCVSCGVTGFAEDTQTDENTEIVEVSSSRLRKNLRRRKRRNPCRSRSPRRCRKNRRKSLRPRRNP